MIHDEWTIRDLINFGSYSELVIVRFLLKDKKENEKKSICSN